MKKIGVLQGDFIGPEITNEAIKVLEAVKHKYNYDIEFEYIYASGDAYDKYGEVLPQISIDKCTDCDVLLKGPFGGPPELVNDPKWSNIERGAILPLRKIFNLFANLRYVKTVKELLDFSNVKRSVVDGVDILIVRELIAGIYFGERGEKQTERGRECYDVESYNEHEISRIAKKAFEFARQRRERRYGVGCEGRNGSLPLESPLRQGLLHQEGGKVTLVGKSNVLLSSVLWREVVGDIAKNYPDVTLEYMHVDNASMQLILNPKQFDVMLTTNMFGDILSDEASVLSGSIGLFPSASLGETDFGLYEPIHGSAPSIAGKNIANPVSSILCASMMFEYSFREPGIAQDIENAVNKVFTDGYRTIDLYDKNDANLKLVGTKEFGDLVVDNLAK